MNIWLWLYRYFHRFKRLLWSILQWTNKILEHVRCIEKDMKPLSTQWHQDFGENSNSKVMVSVSYNSNDIKWHEWMLVWCHHVLTKNASKLVNQKQTPRHYLCTHIKQTRIRKLHLPLTITIYRSVSVFISVVCARCTMKFICSNGLFGQGTPVKNILI